jgi:hypothetical protein
VKTCKLAVLLLILVLLTPVNVGAAPANVKIPPECFAIPHHVKYDLSGYIASGAGMTWVDKATNSITYAVQLTECGGAWFYQISRSGNFQTNFFPHENDYARLGFLKATRLAWAYIKNNVRGWTQVPVGAMFYYPFTWVQVGRGPWDGCWVGIDGLAVPSMNLASKRDWCAEGGFR